MTGDLQGHTDIGVSTFLLRRHDSTVEVLLLRRATRRFFRHWFPIEGRIEEGETPEQAALREVCEETCIHPAEFFREQREPVLLVDLGLSIYVFVGFTHPSAQVVLNDEHSAFAWVHPTEAAIRLPLPSQRATLRRIYEHFIVQQPEERRFVSSNRHTRKVKAVCFDVANVLVEIDIAYAITRLGLYVDDRLSQKIHALGQWATYDAFERGHLLEAQFLRALSTHLAINLHHTELVAWWNSSLRKMVDGVEHVVCEIIGHMPVYALTNTNPLHLDYLMCNMPLLQRFDRVIASFHVGHRKPEAQLFTAAAQLMGQSPADILFIDDLMTNVDGAKAVGYQAELCDRSSTRLRDILVQYGVL